MCCYKIYNHVSIANTDDRSKAKADRCQSKLDKKSLVNKLIIIW